MEIYAKLMNNKKLGDNVIDLYKNIKERWFN